MATFTTASTLPTGMNLSTAACFPALRRRPGVSRSRSRSRTPTAAPVTSATYTLCIACQTITVNTPVNTTGTVSADVQRDLTTTNAIGPVTFSTASTLPAGLTLSTAGVLSGTPTQTGCFPIVVMVTDANGCTGISATYTLCIACQTITVTSPVNTNGTVSAAFSETFTQTAAVGGATFTINTGTLPAGLTLATNGVL